MSVLRRNTSFLFWRSTIKKKRGWGIVKFRYKTLDDEYKTWKKELNKDYKSLENGYVVE